MQRYARFKRFATVAAAAVGMGAAGAWLSFQHIPSWYRPSWLTRAAAEAVRREAEHTFEMAGEKLIAGEPFTLSLSERQINDMLSAQQVIWPAALASLGPQLTDPCVDVAAGHIKVGLRWQSGEIQTVLNSRVVLRESDGELTLSAARACAGSLPIPASAMWRRFVDRPNPESAVNAAAQPAPSRPDTLTGIVHRLLVSGESVSLDGVFYWPNGEIPFTISDLVLQQDRIIVSVTPLAD